MRLSRPLRVKAFAVPVAALMLTAYGWAATNYKVLHSFGAGNDGYAPTAPVILDAKGNIYGTTGGGGAYGYGTAFEMTHEPSGWAESVLYSFGSTNSDGFPPISGLVLDASGNLYGTTVNGGVYLWYGGTAFELSPGPSGWTETIVHSFCEAGSGDGCQPYAGLIFDAPGNLYGTTRTGQASYGTAYELSPGSGGWTDTVLYGFRGGSDGYEPFAGLTWDKSGNLYGTTWMGGTYNDGTVYQLAHTPGGSWTERLLRSFGPSNQDGAGPIAGVVFDKPGNLYGSTGGGGPNLCFGEHGCGVVYKLSPGKHGGWKDTRLYDFAQDAGGFNPGGVAIDAAGNLYGTTGAGGDPSCGCGTVFKLSPRPKGKWRYTVLHTFHWADGALPNDLTLDGKGHIYGTTFAGGAYGNGVVFELTP